MLIGVICVSFFWLCLIHWTSFRVFVHWYNKPFSIVKPHRRLSKVSHSFLFPMSQSVSRWLVIKWLLEETPSFTVILYSYHILVKYLGLHLRIKSHSSFLPVYSLPEDPSQCLGLEIFITLRWHQKNSVLNVYYINWEILRQIKTVYV